MQNVTSRVPEPRALLVGLVVVVALVAAMLADAGARRRQARGAVAVRIAVARAFGVPDLVLSSTSRWLRHPSQTEAGAPFADAPASLDTDPAWTEAERHAVLIRVEPADLTVKILREIRDEQRGMREDLRASFAAQAELAGEFRARFEVIEITLRDLAKQMVLLARGVKVAIE